jgi:lipopolysaccharide export system permease protein
MQFLWKYIDEILGKGFTMFELLELIMYYGITIIPMAVPITILIASVMVFGDMSEKYELSSMKSAGVSLLRIMGAGIAIAIFTGMFSLFASNYLKPLANYQFQKQFLALRKQKSALSIEEKIFNDDFKSYIVRVDEVGDDGKQMTDVLLYDHTDSDRSLINLMRSKSGEMYNSEDGKFFIMKLKDGEQYRELPPDKNNRKEKKYSMMRTEFDSYTKIFDMSEFDIDENSFSINRNKEDMLNTFQLLEAIDSVNNKIDLIGESIPSEYINVLKYDNTYVVDSPAMQVISLPTKQSKNSDISNIKNKSIKETYFKELIPKLSQISHDSIVYASSLYSTLRGTEVQQLIRRAVSRSTAIKDRISGSINNEASFSKDRQKYLLRLNQQYSWAVVCILFLFIGGPLGSIISKGGYGYPLLVAILFYMIFVISTIMGEKMLRSENLDGIMAAWIPCLILFPFAVVLTYLALVDAKIPKFSFSFITNLFKKKIQV